MSERFGRCRNQDYCSLAVANTVLRLGEDELFVCPECARPLMEAPAWRQGGAGFGGLLRVLPPLGIVAVGLVAVVLGVQFSETAPKPAAPPRPAVVVAQARRPPAKVVARAAPARPVAKLPPPPAPPPEIVLLTVAAAPPLNTMLLPQLAAGYLTIGRQAQPLIGSIGDAVHVAVPEGGKLLAIVVREAPAGDQGIVDAADISCSVGPAAPDPRKPARLALGAMPAEPHAPVGCALGDTGAATEFGLFLATPAAKQIVAQEGYAPPPPPPAPPPQAKPAAKPAAAKPAAKVALAKGPAKPATGKQAAAKPSPAKAAPNAEAPDEETPDKAAPNNEAPAAAAPAVADNDDDSTPPATPRVVKLPADSQLTAASLKAMTTPDDLSGPAHDDSETAPKPRTVVLPASAQISFAPYQGVKIPAEKLQFHSIGAGETHAPGDVHADCKIGLDGIPTDCRQISHSGTQQEADAILAWLPSGGIRYTPAQKDGHPVAERRVLTVKFGGGKGQGALPPGPPLRTSP